MELSSQIRAHSTYRVGMMATSTLQQNRVNDATTKAMRWSPIVGDPNANAVAYRAAASEYDTCNDRAPPAVPEGGARIKVCYAGAGYTEADGSVTRRRRRVAHGKVLSAPLAGYEIAGVVDEVCPTVSDRGYKCGDRVVLYPEEDLGLSNGLQEYVCIKNLSNLIHVPDNLELKVAAMLPYGGLMAMAAVKRSFRYVNEARAAKGKCSVLIVGAGGLGLWTMTLARYFSQSRAPDSTPSSGEIHVTVADTNTEKLAIAQKKGYDVVHWCQEAHEQYLVERTMNVCGGLVDVVIDFVSSPRTVSRSMSVLNKGGVLLVGGLSGAATPVRIYGLSENEQAIVGIKRGSRDDLEDLVKAVASGEVTVPHYVTYPANQADKVFSDLYECKLTSRAVLQVSETEL